METEKGWRQMDLNWNGDEALRYKTDTETLMMEGMSFCYAVLAEVFHKFDIVS